MPSGYVLGTSPDATRSVEEQSHRGHPAPAAPPADALSTAFSFMTENEIASVLVQLGEGEVRLRTPSGGRKILRV